jgi:hypothetical protein
MKVYRYLTGKDDAAFCHRVTDALNRGWQLYGQPTLTYDDKRGEVICGQAPRTSKARLTIPKWICRSCRIVARMSGATSGALTAFRSPHVAAFMRATRQVLME